MNKITTKSFLFVLLLFFSINNINAQSYENTIVISDLDNTYKITHSWFPPADLWNILFTQKTYKGMTEMFKNMQKQGAKIFFLSNQTKTPKKNIEKMFLKQNIKPDSLILRKSIFHNGEKYKTDAIISVIKQFSDKKFILLGDNLAHDHIIYDKIKNQFPEKVIQVYIRKITEKEVPKSAVIFNSTDEIIRIEKGEGRYKKIDKKH